MYFLYGKDEIIQNVYRLSWSESDGPVQTLGDLRQHYLRFLSGPKFNAPVNLSGDLFVSDPAVEVAIARAFSGGNLNDMDQTTIIGDEFDADAKALRIEQVRQAVVNLRQIDPDLGQMFDLLIHSIFVRQTNRISDGTGAHGGSSSNAIGSIWLSVNDDLTLADLTELLIHEFTHHCLFVDEYCHYHFDYDKIGDPNNYALSAIRNTMRPLDKVIHSIVVAAEISSARERFPILAGVSNTVGVHPDDATVRANTINACDSVLALANLQDLVTARAIDLTVRSREACVQEAPTLESAR